MDFKWNSLTVLPLATSAACQLMTNLNVGNQVVKTFVPFGFVVFVVFLKFQFGTFKPTGICTKTYSYK